MLVVKTRYLIKVMNNGLSLDPLDSYDDELFDQYGYETKQEALDAIIKADYYGSNLIILENAYTELEENEI